MTSLCLPEQQTLLKWSLVLKEEFAPLTVGSTFKRKEFAPSGLDSLVERLCPSGKLKGNHRSCSPL